MLPYLRQRFVQSAISLFGLIAIVFFLARLTGDPTDLLLPVDTPASVRQEFAQRHGFDQPIIVQFGYYLANLLRFDFGQSLHQNAPALDQVLHAMPTTLMLAFWAMTINSGFNRRAVSLSSATKLTISRRTSGREAVKPS